MVPKMLRKISTPNGFRGPNQVKVVCKDNYCMYMGACLLNERFKIQKCILNTRATPGTLQLAL